MRMVGYTNASSPQANHSLRVHEGVCALGGESITPAEIMELDAVGHVDWTHGREHGLVADLAAQAQDSA